MKLTALDIFEYQCGIFLGFPSLGLLLHANSNTSNCVHFLSTVLVEVCVCVWGGSGSTCVAVFANAYKGPCQAYCILKGQCKLKNIYKLSTVLCFLFLIGNVLILWFVSSLFSLIVIAGQFTENCL